MDRWIAMPCKGTLQIDYGLWIVRFTRTDSSRIGVNSHHNGNAFNLLIPWRTTSVMCLTDKNEQLLHCMYSTLWH